MGGRLGGGDVGDSCLVSLLLSSSTSPAFVVIDSHSSLNVPVIIERYRKIQF